MSGSAHGYLGAPYGVFRTADGHLAVAMTRLPDLAEALNSDRLTGSAKSPNASFTKRVEIRCEIEAILIRRDTKAWETVLSGQNAWCAKSLWRAEVLP